MFIKLFNNDSNIWNWMLFMFDYRYFVNRYTCTAFFNNRSSKWSLCISYTVSVTLECFGISGKKHCPVIIQQKT